MSDSQVDWSNEELLSQLRGVSKRLTQLVGAEGWTLQLAFGTANALKEGGAHYEARIVFAALLDAQPDHLWARIALMELLILSGELDEAEAVSNGTPSEHAEHPVLRRYRAEVLHHRGQYLEAIPLAQCAVAAYPEDLAIWELLLSLHRGARKVGDAEEIIATILKHNPSDPLACLAQIELRLIQGDGAGAIRDAIAAMEACPDHEEIRLRAAQAHLAAGEAQTALEILDAFGEEADLAMALNPADILSVRVQAARLTGQGDLAEAALERLLVLNPSDHMALSAKVDMAEAQGDNVALDVALQEAAHVPAVAVRLIKRHHEAGRIDEAKAALEALSGLGDLTGLSAPELWDIAQMGDVLGVDGALSEALAALQTAPDMPWYVALGLTRHVMDQGALPIAEAIAGPLADRIRHPKERDLFVVEDLALRRGPRAALAEARRRGKGRLRDLDGAEQIARTLLAAGAGPLTQRYIAACQRRWPEAESFRAMAIDAALGVGHTKEALRLVKAMPKAVRPEQKARIQQLSADPLAALATCEAAEKKGGQALSQPDAVELELLRGDVAAAERRFKTISTGGGVHESALVARTRSTRVGTMLNEARILNVSQPDWAKAKDSWGSLADAFFLPARAIVEEARAAAPVAEPLHSGPLDLTEDAPAVWQFWPQPRVPDEVQSVADAWSTVAGARHHLLSVTAARDYMQKALGKDGVRALRLVNDPDQKWDLMRLSCLVEYGGLAVDLTQWPGRQAKALLGAPDRLRVWGDPSGAIATEVMSAPPHHPVLRRALDLALASCLAAENDHRWFKTGPGLLTRALAMGLKDGQSLEDLQVEIRPVMDLRQYVHPHRVYEDPTRPAPWKRKTQKIINGLREWAVVKDAMQAAYAERAARTEAFLKAKRGDGAPVTGGQGSTTSSART